MDRAIGKGKKNNFSLVGFRKSTYFCNKKQRYEDFLEN